MFRIKHIFLLMALGVGIGWIVPAQALTSSVKVAYSSWRESIKTSSTVSATGTASFGGFSVEYEASMPIRNRNYFLALGMISAGADARSSDLTTYKINRHKVSGSYVSAAMAIAAQESFNMRLGLDIVSKAVVWPKQNGVNVNSAPFNLGPHLGFDYSVSEGFVFGQKIGTYFAGELFWQLSLAKSF